MGLFCLGGAQPLQAEESARIKVLFVDAYFHENRWAQAFVRVMKEAAEELGIELTVFRPSRWPTAALDGFVAQLRGPQRPDYVVLTIAPGFGASLLEAAERHGVPTFLVNSGLVGGEKERVGGPREQLRLWLGQRLPDDEHAGYALAHRLIDEAIRRGLVGPDGRVEVVALSGTQADYPSLERERGLRRAIRERPDARLRQVVRVDWEAEEARRRAALLLQRYPQATVVWAAGDFLARAAAESLKRRGYDIGGRVLIGGIDWEPWALQAVRDGRFVTSYGAHVLEGAWALVLLYDYHHGLDFAAECLDSRTPMQPATPGRVPALFRLMQEGPQWDGLQFAPFSRSRNPSREACDFSLEEVLRRLAPVPSRPLPGAR